MKSIDVLAAILLIVGGLNWGLVGLFQFDLVQLRLDAGGLRYRIRVDTHIIYYYGLQALMGLGFMLMSLVMTEVINQSVLQNEPLMPGLAEMLGYPGMSNEVTSILTEAQRMALRWAPIKFEFVLFLVLWPLGLVLPYYTTWIYQRINQDLRLALVERWHRLSLSRGVRHRAPCRGQKRWRSNSRSLPHRPRLSGLACPGHPSRR